MFASDRDLLALEPRLFFDVSWASQRLVDSASGGSINAAGDTLTLTSGENFTTLGIGAGFVAVVVATPLEVIERLNATQARVSRLRASAGDPIIPASSGSALKVVIHTFRPQIGIVHRQVLRLLGIEPGGGTPGESDITNPSSLILAETLGALHLIFSSAAALVGSDSTLWAKARMYEERFRRERRRVVAEIDLDGDGRADTIRRANAMQFLRG